MGDAKGRAVSGCRGVTAPAAVIVVILLSMVWLLRHEGRVWWCECRTSRVWIGDVWTSHCSQHLSDPYSLTHLSHGLIFFGLLWPLRRRVGLSWRFVIAVGVASGWEVLENSTFIIERYRTVTMSLDYLGDSVVNSAGDVLCCALGFWAAWRLGLWRTVAVFVASEALLLVLIRDNLTLNVVMLAWPIEAVRAWQAAGH
ncbi:MAG: DUF2585 family protein [Phycisphaerales bacterium]|nr:DUF2585 family protein [Phycisphaerales bacterium]